MKSKFDLWILISALVSIIHGKFINNHHNELNRIRGGDGFQIQKSSDFVVGKDKELLHVSIDMKWLVGSLTNKSTWMDLLDWFVQRILRLHRGYEAEYQYRQSAIRLARDIKQQQQALVSETLLLRIFQKSLLDAQHLLTMKDRYLLVYVEEDELIDNNKNGGSFDELRYMAMIPSMETLMMRHAMGSKRIATLVNNHFIFMTGYSHHPYIQQIQSLIQKKKNKSNNKQEEKKNPPYQPAATTSAVPNRQSTQYSSSSNSKDNNNNVTTSSAIHYPYLVVLTPRSIMSSTPSSVNSNDDNGSLAVEAKSNKMMKFQHKLDMDVIAIFHLDHSPSSEEDDYEDDEEEEEVVKGSRKPAASSRSNSNSRSSCKHQQPTNKHKYRKKNSNSHHELEVERFLLEIIEEKSQQAQRLLEDRIMQDAVKATAATIVDTPFPFPSSSLFSG